MLVNKLFIMKLKFLTLKRKSIFAVLLSVLLVGGACGTFFAVRATSMPKAVHTIVIDAGHGGKDGGAVGKTTQATESFLNLQYALTLGKICKQYGFDVVQTRSDMNGLYSPFASNKKRSEMEKRREIIENSNPDVVVSVHMNSFPSSSARGAQVYHAENSEVGKSLAESVQTSLHKNIEYSRKTVKAGDFYVLNCTETPSILVECGFLSNPEEELLLQDEEYMNKFCYNLFCGILMFFNFR